MDKGASSSEDRATRSSNEAPAGLRHSAGIPCAHTKGPWRYSDDDCAILSEGQRNDWDDLPVQVLDLRGAMGGDDTDADARLISAAPEMFEALNEAFDILGGLDGMAETRGRFLDIIRKARGDQ